MKLGPTPFASRQPIAAVPPPAPQEPIILVHGTFSNTRKAGEELRPWWIADSDFCTKLNEALAARGSPARAGASQLFAWSGKNLESERRKAGRALAQHLRELELNASISRYHLVAHSHGGNVILNALREIQPQRLGAVIFLGTPFLRFRDRKPRFTTKRVAYAFYWLGVAVSIFVVMRHRGIGWAFLAGFLSCIIIAAVEWSNRRKQATTRPGNVYGSGWPSVFVFRADEAVHGLKQVAAMFRQPRTYFNQFFAAPKQKAPWVTPREAPVHSPLSDLNGMPHTQLLRSFLPEIGIGSKLAMHNLSAAKISSPGVLPRVSWEDAILNLARAVWPVNYIAPFVLILIYVLILLPFVIFAAAIALLKAMGGVFSRAKKWLVLGFGPQLTAKYLSQRAFGLDEGMLEDCSEFPPGVGKLEELTEGLQAKIAEQSRAAGGSAGIALFGALAQAEAFDLRKHFEELFTNPELAHTSYYKEQEIINAIAAKIALPRIPLLAKLGITLPAGLSPFGIKPEKE